MKRRGVFKLVEGVILAVFFASAPLFAKDLPRFEPILGGDFVKDLPRSSVAFVDVFDAVCSGVLVGPRHVLTAAHCVKRPYPPSLFLVVVGGQIYEVSKAFISADYKDLDYFTFSNARYDLGLLILDRPVKGAKALRILSGGQPPKKGTLVTIYGYGANEMSGLPGYRALELGKRAEVVVSSLFDGLFGSVHTVSGASVCGGDSGGPVMQSIGKYTVLVGLVTAGTNSINRYGYCALGGDGESIFVNLQSPYAKSFLLGFPALRLVRASDLKLAENLERLVELLSQLTIQQDANILRFGLESLKIQLKALKKSAIKRRRLTLNNLQKKLTTALRHNQTVDELQLLADYMLNILKRLIKAMLS